MRRRNGDDEETKRLPVRTVPPTPASSGSYSPLKTGALPRNRDKRETVPLPPKKNPCYTGAQVATSQGHVHPVKCNPSFAGAKDVDPAHPMRAIQYLKKLGLTESQAQEAFAQMAAIEQRGGVPWKPLQYIADAVDAHAVESREVAGNRALYVKIGGVEGHLQPTVIYDHEYASYVLSSWGDFEELKERLQANEVRQTFTVHLDNLGIGNGEEGAVTAYVSGPGACRWAKDDQSIEGDSWECSDDNFAYAILMDHPGLYESLVEQGYDVDATEYSAPDEADEEDEFEEDED